MLNVRSCKHHYGIDLFCGTFSEYIADNNRYIFIEVPTLDYKFADEPFGMFAEEHVQYFTFESLCNLMKKFDYQPLNAEMNFELHADTPAGFPSITVLYAKVGNQAAELSLTVQKPSIINSTDRLLRYLDISEKLQCTINAKLESITGKRIAVWGTGHVVSRWLACSPLKQKPIVKFYDSDIRKKGTTFFDKLIIPFDPEDIARGEVDTIVIGTYVFQRQIAAIIEAANAGCEVVKLF